MNSHYFVLGKNGQLGRWLTRLVADGEGCALSAAFAHADLDLADRDAVMGLEPDCAGDQVDWLLNAAAYTAVDLCETETSACNATNADGPGHLADWCREQEVSLVHVSTDYVFAGDASEPYRESDPTSPQTAYGRSKLEGEVQVLERLPSAWVVRTSWVFGPGKNFVGAIVRQGVLRKTGKLDGPLRVVDDQLGCPTYAKDLAAGILELTQLQGVKPGGVIHLSNTEPCTWWDFARAILDGVGYRDLEIERVATSEFVTPAARPAYSVLDGSKARGLGISLRSWRDALDDYLASDDFAALHQNLQTEAQAAP